MSQPIKKHKNKNKESIRITGIEYCNDCPFFSHNGNLLICSPNDYKFTGDIDSKINVPEWCGNKKKEK